MAGGSVVTCDDGGATRRFAADETAEGWVELALAAGAVLLHPATALKPAQQAGIMIIPACTRRRI